MQYAKTEFHEGMKVRFNEVYSTDGEILTLIEYDEETGKGRVEDDYMSGWFVHYGMIEPVGEN